MHTIIRIQLLLLLFLPIASTAQRSDKKLAQFKLPASANSGLVDIFIEYEPVFRIDQIGNTASILLNMNVVLSRARSVKGNFWYRYQYEGEQFTDLQLGQDVFAPIDLENLSLRLTILGPNAQTKTVQWDRSMQNQIVMKIEGRFQASEFSAVINDLDYVAFRGEEVIKRAIENFKIARKNKENDKTKAVENSLLEKSSSKKVASADGPTKNTDPKQSAIAESSRADNDFWETGHKSHASKSNNNPVNTGVDKSKLPEFIRTTDGKYYHKDGDNIQEVSYDQYMALKRQRDDQNNVQQINGDKLTPAQQQKAVDDMMTKIKADQARDQKMWEDINKKSELRSRAFAAGVEVNESKEALEENNNLNSSYQSVEQLMADFNQKMANLNSMTSDLELKRNVQVNAAVDANFHEPEMQVYGQGIKLIGGLINSAKESKERKEAQIRLKAQRDAALANIKAEEIRLLTGIRTDLFKKFKEGSLPLSSTRLSAQTIYYFSYAYNPAQLGSKQTTLYISNVFAIDRYSDGTWPFKNSIINDLSKLTPYNEVIHGYYLSKEETEAMRRGMMDIFEKTGGSIIAFAYKGKASSGGSKTGSNDYWEKGKKTNSDSTSREKKPVKKDDFWNN